MTIKEGEMDDVIKKTGIHDLHLWVEKAFAEELEGWPNASLVEDPNTGGAIARVRMSGPRDEVISWILSNGSSVEVLGPVELRIEVRHRLEYALKYHYAGCLSGHKRRLRHQKSAFAKRDLASEDALYQNVEKKFSQGAGTTGVYVEREPKCIKLWTSNLNALFGNTSPLGDGLIKHKYLGELIGDPVDMELALYGIVFEGEFTNGFNQGLYWVLSRTSSLVLLHPSSCREKVAEILANTLGLYQTELADDRI